MIALASDHVGIILKEEIKKLLDEMGLAYHDYGAYSEERTDYPLYGARAAKAVASGECERGIICCGTGVGISLAANKIDGIRCVVCSDCYSAMLSRQHNNTNMLSLGSRVVGADLGKMIARIWLSTDFEGGRHQRRVEQIAALERGEAIE
ncbi:MAG: ribose 5-phosphate isomerase B [Candidatus Limiplasma sp.]|nr:ribose 5-phosphate isomerase B [Candidatus Limiplasma sp.]